LARLVGSSATYDFALKGKGRASMPVISLPSVSTVLKVIDKPALVYWGFRLGIRAGLAAPELTTEEDIYEEAKNQKLTPNQQRDAGGDRGTLRHDYFERLVGGEALEPTNPDELALAVWWETQSKFVSPLLIEEPVWSLNHRYAGQPDLITQYQGDGGRYLSRDQLPQYPSKSRLTLYDLKTSKNIYWTHWLQLAAYAHALRETHGLWPEEWAILHVRDGRARTEFREPSHELFDAFLGALTIYNALQKEDS
jgi:predicted RecB family nuclease